MLAKLACPHCGATALSARDKRLWLEPSKGIPCAHCGQRVSLAYWRWWTGGIPMYLVLILAFTGHIRSWFLILGGIAIAIAFFLFHKVYMVPLVPARRSAWTPYPWRNKRKG